MDLSISNTVNTGLAMRDAQLMQEVQARVTKKAINAQADTVATLMQSLPVVAIDGKIGTRINTQASSPGAVRPPGARASIPRTTPERPPAGASAAAGADRAASPA